MRVSCTAAQDSVLCINRFIRLSLFSLPASLPLLEMWGPPFIQQPGLLDRHKDEFQKALLTFNKPKLDLIPAAPLLSTYFLVEVSETSFPPEPPKIVSVSVSTVLPPVPAPATVTPTAQFSADGAVHSSKAVCVSLYTMVLSKTSDHPVLNFRAQNNQLSDFPMFLIRDYPSSLGILPPMTRTKGIRIPPGKLPPDHASPEHSQA